MTVQPRSPGSTADAPGVMQLVLSLEPGGTERLTIEIAGRLSGRFRMQVCCLDDAGAWAGELEAKGIPVLPLRRRQGFRPALGAQIARLARDRDVSIIHCHHYSPFVYGTLAGLLNRRVKLLYTEHGRLSDAAPAFKRQAANMILSRLSGPAFAVSAALRDHMRAEGFRPARFEVIHNGIAIGPQPCGDDRAGARAALGLSAGDFVVGTVARLDPVKDLGSLIQAIARVTPHVPCVRLVIVGDGPERAALDAAIRAHNVQDAVVLLGYRSNVRDILPAFDVFVNSSVSEGISLTILEAMAAALPVVATRVGGTPEVVVDGVTGVLVEPRSPGLLAEAILDLARSVSRRCAFAEASRARVESAFTIERMVDDYAREYSRLLA